MSLDKCVTLDTSANVVITQDGNSYNFDKVFDQGTQQEVYNETALPVVQKLFEGYNGCVLCH